MYYEYHDPSYHKTEFPQNSVGPDGAPPMGGEGTPKKSRKRLAKKIVAVALACVLVGGVGGTTYYVASTAAAGASGDTATILQSQRDTTKVVTQQVSSTGTQLTKPEIYAKYVASTVGIATEITTTNIFGEPTSAAAAGSGFFITSDGYILTCNHVIEAASTITVTTYDGKEYTAKLVGSDADSDIAVLKADVTGVTPVVIGNSDALLVGEDVSAIGNPLGELTFSFTSGYVSAVNRSVTTSDGMVYNLIQTDCAVNSGNSGGPLFNAYGEVVGIVNMKYASTGVEGLSFAIPINRIISYASDIMENGYVTGKPYMGITVATVSSTDAQRYNLAQGAYVNSVASGSCAETAGLKQGDIITAMDGKTVTSQSDLIALKNNYKAGATVSLTVVRSGETLTLSLTFDEQTPAAEAANSSAASAQENSSSGSQRSQGSYYYSPWGSQYGTNGGTIY